MTATFKIQRARCAGLIACVQLVIAWCVFAASPAWGETMVGALTKSQYESLFAATTQSGMHLSGSQALKVFGDYLLPPKPDRLRQKRLGCGVFVMRVEADGVVSRVEVLRSVGDSAFDKEIAAMFKKVRCRPKSAKEIRIPVYYL